MDVSMLQDPRIVSGDSEGEILYWDNTNKLFQPTDKLTWNESSQLLKAQGALWIDGTTGDTPTSGSGTRLMFIPAKYGAFRAGVVTEDQWDVSNIGNYSAAFGFSTIASGVRAFAANTLNEASGNDSVAFGYYGKASGNYSTHLGFGNDAGGSCSIASGHFLILTSDADYTFAFGYAASEVSIAQPNTFFLYGTSFQMCNSTTGATASDGLLVSLSGANVTIQNQSGNLAIENKITAGSFGSPIDVTATREYGVEIHYSGNDYNCTAIRARASAVTTDTSAQIQGGLFQAANNDGINVGVLNGALIEAIGKSDSTAATISMMRACIVNSEWNEYDTVTNLRTLHIRTHTRNSATQGYISNKGHLVYIENEAVGGNGQMLDAGIYFKETNISGGIKGYDYGIDFSGAVFNSAELKFSNGETIDNIIDGEISISGDTIVETLTLTDATQDYKFVARTGTNALCLQSQSPAEACSFAFYTKDGDGTDDLWFRWIAKGTPDNMTNSEALQFRYISANPRFLFYTTRTGSGSDLPIEIRTGSNSNQLYIHTDGKVGIGTIPSTKLHVAGGNVRVTNGTTDAGTSCEADAYTVGGVAGCDFNGAITNITVVKGIVTAVS